jgi:hypothetical protein
MLEKGVGGCAVLVCFLLGGFLAIASFFAMEGGKDDFYLPLLLALGVCMVVGGFALAWMLVRPRPAKRRGAGDDGDDGW